MSKKKLDFKIGCDPEFSSAGHSMYPEEYIADMYDGPVGYDGDNFEVRPKPDTSPLKVVANISKCLKLMGLKTLPKMPNKKIVATPARYCGGHVHLSITKSPVALVRALDIFLGCITKICDPKSAQNRLGDGYGNFGDHRRQSYGIEYRTPSTFLREPLYAKAVLCTAKVIGHEFLNNKKNTEFKVSKNLRLLIENSSDDYGTPLTYTYSYDKIIKLINNDIDNIYKRIKTFGLYSQYKYYVDKLYKYYPTHKESWNSDMVKTWNVIIAKPEKKVDVPWFTPRHSNDW